MTGTRKRLFAWLLVGVLTGSSSLAQEQPPPEEPLPPPDLASLQSGWWTSYFENIGPAVQRERIEPFLAAIEARSASLRPADLEVSQSIVAAIRDNLRRRLASGDIVL